jgi:hypothetical protein
VAAKPQELPGGRAPTHEVDLIVWDERVHGRDECGRE